MPLIAECDHPDCVRRVVVQWLPSGRLVTPQGWCVMPGERLVVACSFEHVPGMVPPTVPKPPICR